MDNKRRAVLYAAITFALAAVTNPVSAAALTAGQTGSQQANVNQAEKQTEAYRQFSQLVEQQKYNEAIACLREVYKFDTVNLLRTAMLLDNPEQARRVVEQAVDRYTPNSAEHDDLYNYAVSLARGGHFSEALSILKCMYNANPQDKAVAYDYIVVLSWSGNSRSAAEAYEKLGTDELPAYVLSGAAGAYYQLENFKRAQELFHAVGLSGDRKAVIWEAQSFYRLGDIASADRIYERLLQETPGDVDVLRSRASMLMLTRNYREAVAEFERIITATAGLPNAADIRKTVEYDMAIAYIRLDEEAKSIALLKPYVENGTADVFMQSDYVLALRLNRDYPEAIREGTRLWKDYGQVPVFGLQALADSYVRSGNTAKAIPIYQHILRRDGNNNAVKLGLAFAQMMTGRVEEGAKVYDELLAIEPSLVDIALDDAYFFNERGRYDAGNRLFELIVKRFPDKELYRQEYAGSLQDNDMPRQAYRQYTALAKIPGGEPAGLAGMTQAAVAVGDYALAKAHLAALQERYAQHTLTLDALRAWEERRLGGVELGFTLSRDYKGLENRTWRLTGDQTLGGSFSGLAEITRAKITDHFADPEESTSVTTYSGGLGYKGIRFDAQAWLHSFRNNGSFSGYSLITNYYPNDTVSFGFDITHNPLLDPQALNPTLAGYNEGRITTTNYTFRTSIRSGEKDTFNLAFTRSLYSDNNQVNNIEFNWTRTTLFTEKKEQYWFLNWGRESFLLQRDDLYESPPVRDTYGFGITQRWIYPKHYWEGTLALQWDRDRPQPTDFGPYARLEYGYNFTPASSLVLGVEYGLRTDRANGLSSLRFSYRQYDMLYRFSW